MNQDRESREKPEERRRCRELMSREVLLPETRMFQEIAPEEMERSVRDFEREHPRCGQALDRFFSQADGRFDVHLLRLRYMIYMLEPPVLDALIGMLEDHPDFRLKLEEKEGRAALRQGYRGQVWIDYGNVRQAEQYKPPYKTFFHEIGHALDHFQGKEQKGTAGKLSLPGRLLGLLRRLFGKDAPVGRNPAAGKGQPFCSQWFVSSQPAQNKRLTVREHAGLILEDQVRTDVRTIHQWALLDLENALIQGAFDLLQGLSEGKHSSWYRTLPPKEQLSLAQKVIYDLFLTWNGAYRLRLLRQAETGREKDAVTALYLDLREKMETGLLTPGGVPALPRDIWGGLTGNQIGGGHPAEYWYRCRGFRRGKRINEISKEAFAGYFEYRALGLDREYPLLDPQGQMPHTLRALRELYQRILEGQKGRTAPEAEDPESGSD